MFKVNISDILGEIGRKKEIKTPVNLKIEDELYKVKGLSSAELKFTNLGSLVLVTGTVQATVVLACDRCTEQFEQEITAEAEEEFSFEENLLQFSPEDRKLGREDLLFLIDPQGNIDLEELIRQALFSALPLQKICRACPEPVHYKANL